MAKHPRTIFCRHLTWFQVRCGCAVSSASVMIPIRCPRNYKFFYSEKEFTSRSEMVLLLYLKLWVVQAVVLVVSWLRQDSR